MKIKIIYEKPEGQGELALGIAIDQTIRKKFPQVGIEVEMKGKSCNIDKTRSDT